LGSLAEIIHHLSVFPLEVPPLHERREDIAMLAVHFIERSAARLHLPTPRLSAANEEELCRYPWPGNIRELQNVIERAVILSQGQPLHFDLRGSARTGWADPSAQLTVPLTRKQLLALERWSIQEALQKSGGKIYGPGGAAELLGLRPTTLSSKIATLGIKRRQPLG
jgi:DNA-binding NtrC family response regulator